MIRAYATCSLLETDEVVKLFRMDRLNVVEHLARRHGLRATRSELRTDAAHLVYVLVEVPYDRPNPDDARPGRPTADDDGERLRDLLIEMEAVDAGSLICEADTEAELRFLQTIPLPGLLTGRTGTLVPRPRSHATLRVRPRATPPATPPV